MSGTEETKPTSVAEVPDHLSEPVLHHVRGGPTLLAERLLKTAHTIGDVLRGEGERVHCVEIVVYRNPKQQLTSAVAILPSPRGG